MLLFVASWLLRLDLPERPDAVPLVFSFMGAGLALLTGWLGGELVDRLSRVIATTFLRNLINPSPGW